MKILLIGGTGTISSSVTARLLAEGKHRVFLLNRGTHPARVPAGAETIQADIHNTEEVRRAISLRQFDAVADFLVYGPDDARQRLDLFAGKTGQFLFVSTCATYEKPIPAYPITESTRQGNQFWDYGRQKIAAEAVFLEAHHSGSLPLTIVRPSHTYDYRNFPLALRGKKRSWQTVLRLRAGKPVVIPGDGTSLWTLTHADDFAVGFTGLVGNPLALGEAVNLVSDDVVTWNGVYRRLADLLGVPLHSIHIPSDILAQSDAALVGELLGDKANSLYFDNRKLKRLAPEFGTTIRFEQAAPEILRQMQASPELCVPDPEWEAWLDRVIERFQPVRRD